MRGPEVETASHVAKIWVTTQTKKKWMRASLGRKESKGSYLGNTIQLEKMMIYHEIGVLLPFFLHVFLFSPYLGGCFQYVSHISVECLVGLPSFTGLHAIQEG